MCPTFADGKQSVGILFQLVPKLVIVVSDQLTALTGKVVNTLLAASNSSAIDRNLTAMCRHTDGAGEGRGLCTGEELFEECSDLPIAGQSRGVGFSAFFHLAILVLQFEGNLNGGCSGIADRHP